MKRKISVVLALLLVILMLPLQSFAEGMDTWAKEALTHAIENDILYFNEGEVAPDKILTRAEIAVMMNRVLGTTDKSGISRYTDLDVTDWYYEDMSKAVASKLFEGYGNQLRPEDPVTREEMFTVISRSLDIFSESESKYIDSELISEWAENSIVGLTEQGYLRGYPNGTVNPKGNITKAEFSQVLYNIFNNYISKSGTYEQVGSGNVVINVPGVILKGVSITGDLIIGDGVGDEEVTLEDVNINGRLVVRGGGENSIIIRGDSDIRNIVILKINGKVRVFNETGKEIEVTHVQGNDDVILEGKFNDVVIGSNDISVFAKKADIEIAVIKGERSEFIVEDASKVGKVEVSAENVIIGGEGEIDEVTVTKEGSGTKITTPNTEIDVARGAVDVEGTGGVIIKSNKIYVNGRTDSQDAKPLEEPRDNSGGSSGGSSGSSGGSTTITKYMINYSVVGSNGTLTGTVTSGNSVNNGTSVTFTAAPATGYEIKEWKVNGTAVESGNTLTRTISANTTVTVEFKLIPEPEMFTVIYNVVGENGTIESTISSGVGVEPNTELTFTATPSDGYEIKEWKVNNEVVEAGSTLTTTITAYTMVSVEFQAIVVEPTTYSLTYSVIGEGGTLTGEIPSGTQAYSGSTVRLTATAAEGHRVKTWTVNGTPVSDFTATEYTAEMNRDNVVTVEFEEIPATMYTVNFSTVGGVGNLYASVEGIGHIYDGNQVAEGTNATFTADIPSGYEIKEWRYNGYLVEPGDNILTISNIGMDITVTVEFEEISDGIHTVNFSTIDGIGSITANADGIGAISSGAEVPDGYDIIFTAEIPDGYKIKEWSVNGDIFYPYRDENTFIVHYIWADMNVTVEFEEIPIVTHEILIFVENVDGATVEVKDAENTVIPVTKIQGKNYFYDLEAGSYTYTVSKDGYYTVERVLEVTEPDTEYVTMVEVLPGVVSVEEFPIYEMNVGGYEPGLPGTVMVTLDTSAQIEVSVVWDVSSFDKFVAGNYVLLGTLDIPDGVGNPMDIKAEYLIDVFAAPEITLDITNSNILRFDFDVPIVWVGELGLEDIGTPEYTKLAFLQDLFNDPTLDASVLNEENIGIGFGLEHLQIELMDDAINKDLFWDLDNPEGLYGGNGDGVYRKDVAVDLSIFNNHLGLASESTAEPFKLKFFIPMENGAIDYSQPIEGVWQTKEQRDTEVDPVLDTTNPEFIGVTTSPLADEVTNGSLVERHIWIEEGDSIVVQITAEDDNLRRMKIFEDISGTGEGSWYYADANVYNGPTDIFVDEDEGYGIDVSYANGTWTMTFGPEFSASVPAIIFELDFEDYAGNSWSDVETSLENRTFIFIPNVLDRTDLNAIKAEIAGLLQAYYSPETWADIDTAMLMPESTQDEIDAKFLALLTAKENLYELLDGTNDKYTIESNSTNNPFYVLHNDRGTGIALVSAMNGTFGTTTAFMDRIDYTPDPGFSGVDTFTYTIETAHESAIVTVTVTVEPSGTYMTSAFASDGTEFGFYHDEGGIKAVIEDRDTYELYIGDTGAYNWEAIDGEFDVTLKYYISDDLYTRVVGTYSTSLTLEPQLLDSSMETPLQALEIQDVNGVGLNEIEVGKAYTISHNKVPLDTTDVVVHEWEIVYGDATITSFGEIIANSPGEIVARVYNMNTEIGSFSDEITLNAYNMYTISAEIVGNPYGTIEMSIDGKHIDNPSVVKEGTIVDVVVTPIDETIEVVEWYSNGSPLPITSFSGIANVDKDITVGVKLIKTNTPPVANDDYVDVEFNGSVLIDIMLNDEDIDGDTLYIAGFSQASNGVVSPEGDSLRYTPHLGFTGVEEFMYEISDGNGGVDTAIVTVTVINW